MAKGMAKGGGVKNWRDVMSYKMPQGPTSIGNKKVGLGGFNYGNCGTQGPAPTVSKEGGVLGLGGENRGKGENRKG